MPDPRIFYLLKKFKADTITPPERSELLVLLANEENKAIYDNFFADQWQSFVPEREIFSHDEGAALLRRIRQINAGEKVSRKKNYIKYVGLSIAASLILFSVVALYFNRAAINIDQTAKVSVKHPKIPDLEPGGNHAILTLADNRRIVLDSVSNGTVVSFGNLLVSKTNEGRLVFEVHNVSNPQNYNPVNTISTPRGGEYNVILPDGTQVWLNSATSISFPSFFSGAKRYVKLRGEAYFEVSKNKSMPFNVDAGSSTIEVLGTHFNVNAYPDDKISRTTLFEGSVSVSSIQDRRVIKPGEQVIVNTGSGDMNLKDANLDEALAWKNGYFVFTDENIHSIMKKLGRWYNFETEFKDEMANENFGGSISKFKTLAEVLNIFQTTGTIHFKIIPGDNSGHERRVVVMK